VRAFAVFLVAVFACALPWSAGAHHSTANFDHTKTETLHGVVKYFAFTNPHSVMDLEVQTESGEKQMYKIFTVGKVLMKRYGWTEKDVKAGDKVTVSGNPDRHDPHYLYLTNIVFASGKTWSRASIPD
jgi:hypothetical protein